MYVFGPKQFGIHLRTNANVTGAAQFVFCLGQRDSLPHLRNAPVAMEEIRSDVRFREPFFIREPG